MTGNVPCAKINPHFVLGTRCNHVINLCFKSGSSKNTDNNVNNNNNNDDNNDNYFRSVLYS